MINLKQRRLAALVAAVVLVPTSVGAQTIARSFGELQRTLKIGQTVFVTDTSGRQTRGKVADLTASSLVILTPETLTFLEGTVTDIRRTDRWWKGALIGLGVGVLPGMAAGFAGCAQYDYPGCVLGPIYGMLSVGGITAAIGMGIDALVNKVGRVVYLSPELAVTVVSPPSVAAPAAEPSVALRARPASTASSFTELRLLVAEGQIVSVTDASGRQTRGTIADVSPASVGLKVDGARLDFAETDVRQLDRLGDPLWNGTVVGLSVGAGVGLVSGVIAARDDRSGFLGPILLGANLLAGITVGGVTGLIVDAVHKQRKTVYLAPTQRAGVALAPLLEKGRRGILVSVGF